MYGKMQESGLTEIIIFDIYLSICTSAVRGQNPVFSRPESPQGAPLGRGAEGDGEWLQQ